MAEVGVQTEFLVLGETDSVGDAGTVGEFPVRHVPLTDYHYGTVLRAARDACRGKWLITLETPSSNDVSLVYGFWHRRHEAQLLLASRYAHGGSTRMPFLRRVASRFLNWTYRKGLSVHVRDLSSARRMYATGLLRKIDIEGADFEVLMEVLLKFMANGGHVMEVPWHFESRDYRHIPGTLSRQLFSCLGTFRKMHRLRNGVGFVDYDYRAYDSRIWFQRYWQRTRFKIIREFEGDPGFALDAGCGTSRIITTRPEMIAMDLNLNRLRFLSKTNPRRLQATAGELPFADDAFDTVISSQVIEHTPEKTCLTESVRVLKEGGTLILGTPDYESLWPYIETVYGWVKPSGYAEEHITHYTLKSLIAAIEEENCEVLDYKYICYGELIIRARKLPAKA